MVLAGVGFFVLVVLLVCYEIWKEKQGDKEYDDRD